jgi:hypothetical protein
MPGNDDIFDNPRKERVQPKVPQQPPNRVAEMRGSFTSPFGSDVTGQNTQNDLHERTAGYLNLSR